MPVPPSLPSASRVRRTNIVSAAVRILFALLGAYVVISLLVLGHARELATFTLQSNLLMAVSFGWTAVALLARKRTPPEWLAGNAVFLIAITGIVYYFVLRPDDFPRAGSLVGWFLNNNNIEHIVTPVGAFLVWFLLAEHRRVPVEVRRRLARLRRRVRRGRFSTLAAVIPGQEAPYDFLKTSLYGVGGVAWRVVLFFAGFGALAAALIWLDHLLPKRFPFGEYDTEDPANSSKR